MRATQQQSLAGDTPRTQSKGHPQTDDRSCGARTTDASDVRNCERRLLFGDHAKGLEEAQGLGLTFSGGGIRSASFGLGVFQCLLLQDVFQRFDYLSTVSGGGYLGSAITWLTHCTVGGAKALQELKKQFRSSQDSARGARRGRNVWLDYIRQHSSYLTPGKMSDLSLAGSVLRGVLLNVAVYGAVLVAIVTVLIILNCRVYPGTSKGAYPWAIIEPALAFMLLLGAGSVALYSLATWLASLRNWAATALGLLLLMLLGALVYLEYHWEALQSVGWSGWALRWPAIAATVVLGIYAVVRWCSLLRETVRTQGSLWTRASHRWQYHARVQYQQYLGAGLGILLGLLLLWTLPYVAAILSEPHWKLSAASLSTLLGAVGAVHQFFVGRSKAASSSLPAGIRISAAALLLIYGLLLFSYVIGQEIEGMDSRWALIGALVAGAGLLGWLTNTNYFGLGRMYRDRLMEAFLPDCSAVECCEWAEATQADEAKLTDFRTLKGAAKDAMQRPLHLLNCNVVMVDARSDKFRGRGGDSFVLTPWYSGSDATGWVGTERLGDGTLTLATAMATSGAAVNPGTGVDGHGVTRNRLVSFLLSFFNIRLGYWLPNPRSPRASGTSFWPNLWVPGVVQGLMGRGLNERAHFIELTDGGHFDNTGLYELIRRRVKVIVLCEGGEDEGYQMEDLANAIERVRADFGVHIKFDCTSYPLSDIRPHSCTGLSVRGFAVGRIEYPLAGQAHEPGVLLYLQAALVKGVSADVESYRLRHADFPNESTADQFFDEEQIEAYRELGHAIAEEALYALRRQGDSAPAELQCLRQHLCQVR